MKIWMKMSRLATWDNATRGCDLKRACAASHFGNGNTCGVSSVQQWWKGSNCYNSRGARTAERDCGRTQTSTYMQRAGTDAHKLQHNGGHSSCRAKPNKDRRKRKETPRVKAFYFKKKKRILCMLLQKCYLALLTQTCGTLMEISPWWVITVAWWIFKLPSQSLGCAAGASKGTLRQTHTYTR